jgi:predicted phosphodiesterase
VNSFTTAVPEGESGFSFVVYGDTRTYQERHKTLMNEMAKEDIRFIMHTGDLVDDARVLSQLDGFFEAIRKPAKQIPFLPVIGNHEYGSKYFYDYFDVHEGGGVRGEQWYSFTYGNVKFIALSSQVITMWNDEEAMQKQTEWLKQELKESDAEFNFVIYHQPSYSSIKAPGNKVLRKYWGDIFQNYPVDAVFNADAHSYERLNVNGLPYIVAAGGGAPLYEVEERQPQTQVLNNTHLHYTVVTVKDGEATMTTKKVLRVPNKDKPTQVEPDKGILDEFTISAK